MNNENLCIITNLMLLRLRDKLVKQTSYVLVPDVMPYGSQNNKIVTLQSFIHYLNNQRFKEHLSLCMNDIELNEYSFSNEELQTIRSNILEVLELYFATSKFEFNNLKKSSLKINYTPRHYVASHILHLKYKKAVFSNDSFAKIWEFIWDAQNSNLNEKVQQLIGVLSLSPPCQSSCPVFFSQ